jgi:uncharacterized protein (DUF1697 family)
MPTYVAMLRSVNVGGRNRLGMDDLRAVVASAGYRNATTYVQSGNVVFAGRGSPKTVGRAIEGRLSSELGLAVAVLVRSRDQLEAVLNRTPFTRRHLDPKTLHVTFLAEAPDSGAVETLAAEAGRFGKDRATVVGQEVYLHCPGGYGQTKLNNTFLERRLDRVATTRNWRTVTTLAGMAGLEV